MSFIERIVVPVLLGTTLLFAGLFLWTKRSAERRFSELRDQIAMADKSIEVYKGLYTRLTREVDDLQDLLDSRDVQLAELKKRLEKAEHEILTVNTLVIKWKTAYEGVVKATQIDETGRKRVDFENDFGYIGVEGYTLTDPPFAWVKIQQNRPLKVSMAISQDKNRRWHTYATSSEENVSVEIELTAVDPWVLKPKWYEKIGLETNVGGGESGLILGTGLTYNTGQFKLGPMAWMTVGSGEPRKYFGASVTWHPFARD